MVEFSAVPAAPETIPIPLSPLQDTPLVSILIPNYNYADFVGEAIRSALDQTYPNIEVIVCDDGSTDHSLEIIDGCAHTDPRVKVISKPNAGHASAFNAAYRASKGDIICLLDSDDAFYRDKVVSVVQFFKGNSDTGYVHHPMMIVNQRNEEVQRLPVGIKLEEGWLRERVMQRGGSWRWTPTSAICLRRELAEYLFPIPEPLLTWCADSFIALLSVYLTNIGLVNDVLSKYRIHGRNVVGSNAPTLTSAKRIIEATHLPTHVVNERFVSWGLDELIVDVSRNSNLQHQEFLMLLLKNENRARLVREFVRMLPVWITDDLFPRTWRAVRPIIYGVSIVLPHRARTWFLGQTLGSSWIKSQISRLMRIPKRLRTLTRRDIPANT